MPIWAEHLEEYRLLIVLTGLLSLFIAETIFPLRKRAHRLAPRLWVNGCLSLLSLGVAAAIVRPLTVKTLSSAPFGLLHWISAPAWLEIGASFLLLDLSFYYWHRLNHSLAFLWRFHNVHHFDPDLDTSTAFRFHFAEVGISVVFRVVQVGIIGVSLPAFVLYEVLFQLATYFHHSNLRLSPDIDWALSIFLVTPRLHGVHHSHLRGETNSNYSVVFSVWDRLHRTFQRNGPPEQIVVGVPGYSFPSDNKIGNVLLAPFRRQRQYWPNEAFPSSP